jgi:cytochrome c2
MARRFSLLVLFALAVSLVLFSPASAGGWAVVTLDSWPENIVAGEPVEISMTVRQHGRTLLEGLDVTVKAFSPSSKQSFQVEAVDLKQPGRYVASVVFPEAGRWEWTINAFMADHPMPDLEVQARSVAVENSTSKNTTTPEQASALPVGRQTLTLLAITSLALGAGMAALAAWRKLRLAWMLAGIFGALAVFSLVFTNQPEVMAAEAEVPQVAANNSAQAENQKVSTLSASELGEKLFIAKGCATCHQHPAISSAEAFSVNIKSLSGYKAIPEYLRVWLKDPAAIKPEAEMPNLELKESEIEALIAFLSD